MGLRSTMGMTLRVFTIIIISLALTIPTVDIGKIEVQEEHDETTRPVGMTVPEAAIAMSVLDGHFTQNLGQVGDGGGHYYARGDGLDVAFGTGWFAYDILDDGTGQGAVVRIWFQDAFDIVPTGHHPLTQRSNFIFGNDPGTWQRNVMSFKEVRYANLWDGIDLLFRFEGSLLKYDLVVGAGADPAAIGMRFEGATGLEIEPSSGDLLIRTSAGVLRDMAPYAYQGNGPPLDCSFGIDNDRDLCFQIGPYDRGLPLVIDPGLEFGTYFGGTYDDAIYDVDIDGSGNIYVGGRTESGDIPVTVGAYSRFAGLEEDCFIAKLNANASAVEYCTFIGSNDEEYVQSIEVDDGGSVYAIGYRESLFFPVTSDAFAATDGDGYDGFFLRLDKTGSSLLYSTHIGASDDDLMQGLSVDADGYAYISVWTRSWDFPTTVGAHSNTMKGDFDLAVMKFAMSPNSLVYSTFLGGSDREWTELDAIEADGQGRVVIGGTTGSMDFPVTSGAYCTTKSDKQDGFITRISSDGTTILHSTFVGGSASIHGIAIDGAKDVWAAGTNMYAELQTTPDAMQKESHGSNEGIIMKLSYDLSTVMYLTYFGAESHDSVRSVELDRDGDLVFYGMAKNGLRIPSGAVLGSHTRYKTTSSYYIARMDTDTGRLQNGTYTNEELGTHSVEMFKTLFFEGGMKVAPDGTIVTVGETRHDDLMTTPGALYEEEIGQRENGYILGISMENTPWALPGPPRDLNVTGPEPWQLTWQPPDHDGSWSILNYTVYMGTSQGGEVFLEKVGPTTDYLLEGYTDYQPVWFRLSANTVVGEGPVSDPIKFTPWRMPSEPLNLEAEAVEGNVHLSWDAPFDYGGQNLLGYQVFRSGSNNTTGQMIAVNDISTSYVDADVDNGTWYYYSVRAFHEYGEGWFSETVGIKPTGPPPAPQQLEVVALDDGVLLNWSPPKADGGLPILGYVVFRGTSPDELWLFRESWNMTSLFDMEAPIGVNLFYAVKAYNAYGQGKLSSIVNATVILLPGAPLNLTGQGWHERVTLSWEPPDDDGGGSLQYRVYRGSSRDSLSLAATTPNISFEDTGLSNQGRYFYGVSAVNERGEGPRTEPISVVPRGVPSEVRFLQVEPGNMILTLSWLPPTLQEGPGIAFYDVSRGYTDDTLSLFAQVEAEDLGFVDTEVDVGRTYHYSVRATNSEGSGPASGVVSGAAFGPPGVPVNFAATSGDGMVSLTWDEPEYDGYSPVTKYVLYRRTTGGSLRVHLTVFDAWATDDVDLDNGMKYFYAVAAYNDAGEGDMTAVLSVVAKGPTTVPGTLDSLRSSQKEGDVVLAWAPPEENGGTEIVGYVVYRSKGEDAMEPIAYLETTLTYKDKDVKPGRTYRYAVAAINGEGEGEPSESVKVVVKEESPGFNLVIFMFAVVSAAMIAISRRDTCRVRGN